MSLEDLGFFGGMIGGPILLALAKSNSPEIRDFENSEAFTLVFGTASAVIGANIGRYIGRFLDDYVILPIQEIREERSKRKQGKKRNYWNYW